MQRPVNQFGGVGSIVLQLLLVVCLGMAKVAGAETPAEIVASNSIVKYGPPSSWVKPHFHDQQPTASLLEATADQHLLLLEKQINTAQDETFVHCVRQVISLDGVQKDSTLKIGFNPGYQALTWHWARIWRGAAHLERLDTNSVKIVQQEQDLDNYLLTGDKSAVLVLDDVRIGDIIDYAYSIKGANPVLGERFSSEVMVQLGEPAERLYTRLLWPSQRHLYAKPHGCTVQPAAVAGKTAVEYTWDMRQIPALPIEDELPGWCDPQPWVQLSEFRTWTEVNQWALGLFQVTVPFTPALSQKISEWKQISGQEQQILAVLKFVQEEVRYFGIEIGASTEKPADPSAIFQRRFGDCKDKSQLFVTILRALGIEAYPVLVNSTSGRQLDDWQPSAGAFDHCIAVVQYEGQMYWVDPTMNYQRGQLAAHFLPAYERGLIIAPNTTGLSVIPQTTGLPLTTTTEYFNIGGKTDPTTLRVVTVAQGRDADTLRELFATTKRTDLEKNYVHFYASLYPTIKTASPIVIADDEGQNRIQTTEYYSIDKAWTQSDRDKKYRFDFYPYTISGLMKAPVDTDRKLPLSINFPEHQILRTEATLPAEWQTDNEKKTIYDPAFAFQKECRCGGNKLVMEYGYQTLADSVAPEAVGQYIQRLNQSSQALGYTLEWK